MVLFLHFACGSCVSTPIIGFAKTEEEFFRVMSRLGPMGIVAISINSENGSVILGTYVLLQPFY